MPPAPPSPPVARPPPQPADRPVSAAMAPSGCQAAAAPSDCHAAAARRRAPPAARPLPARPREPRELLESRVPFRLQVPALPAAADLVALSVPASDPGAGLAPPAPA